MKRWLRIALQLSGFVLFAIILWRAGPATLQEVLGGDPKHVLAAFLLLGTATVLSAWRFLLVARSLTGQRIGSWKRFYYLNTATRAAGLVVPRSLSTFAGKPAALHSLGLTIGHSVWVVLTDNLFDLALLLILAVPGLLSLGTRLSSKLILGLALLLVLALIGGFWWATGDNRLSRLFQRAERMPCLRSILPSTSQIAVDWKAQRPSIARAFGLTLMINVALASCYHQVGSALGLSRSWFLFAAGFVSVQLSLVLAITPGGLGVFDAGWYGVLLLGGVSKEEAVAFVIAQRAYITVFVLLWAGFATLLSLTPEILRRED